LSEGAFIQRFASFLLKMDAAADFRGVAGPCRSLAMYSVVFVNLVQMVPDRPPSVRDFGGTGCQV